MHPDIQELISIFNFPFSIHVMTDDSLPQSEILLYQAEDGRTRIQCRLEGDTLWLTQALIADLFQKDVRTINEHLMNIFEEGELRREATIRKFRIVRQEGGRPAEEPTGPRAKGLLRRTTGAHPRHPVLRTALLPEGPRYLRHERGLHAEHRDVPAVLCHGAEQDALGSVRTDGSRGHSCAGGRAQAVHGANELPLTAELWPD